MQISEIRVKLVTNPSDRLKAFCTITFDNSFVIRDLKIIEGSGGYFVAMPSRKLTDHCPSCGAKNHLRARFCNDCGFRLDENRALKGDRGRTKLHADIAHPVNAQSREYIQARIIEAFTQEVERSKQPGYKPTLLGDEDYDYEQDQHQHHEDSGSKSDKVSSEPAKPAQPEPQESEAKPNISSFSEGVL
jgi:stage V sporulation protein G